MCVCVCPELLSIIFCLNFFKETFQKKEEKKKKKRSRKFAFGEVHKRVSIQRCQENGQENVFLFKEEKFHSSCCRCRWRPPNFQPAALSLLRDGCWNFSFSLSSPTLQDLSSSVWSQRHFNLQPKNWETSCNWKCQLSFVSLWSVVEHLSRSTLFGRFHSSKHLQKRFPNYLPVQDQVLRMWTRNRETCEKNKN